MSRPMGLGEVKSSGVFFVMRISPVGTRIPSVAIQRFA
jgi:hypothetical protein